MSDRPAIELREVSARSGDRVRLHPSSLELRRGTVTGLIGRNGSGKSTMLALMASELRPSSGTVLVNGDDIHSLSLTERAQRRAILTQDTAVSFPFSVGEVVSWGRTPWQRTDRAADNDRVVAEAIAAQGLTELIDRPVTSLSGGERKRVHIARVLAQQADVLLLDEADADLDLVGRRVVDDLVVDHAHRGHTAIIVSHDLSRLARVCDQFILMRAGHVQAIGSPDHVLTDEQLSQAFGAMVAVTGEGDALTIHVP
jgi:iron complex transport system ATP-binding protein